MSYYIVDIEADGPIPGKYSMLSLGAVHLDTELETSFYAELQPISNIFVLDALAVSSLNREDLLKNGQQPKEVMEAFEAWVLQTSDGKRNMFVADNAGFDWMFVCWYFHTYLGRNPFGFSPFSITSFYKGLRGDMRATFKNLRGVPHTHNALDDAKGNANAFRAIQKMGIRNF